MSKGTVLSINIARAASGPMEQLAEVNAFAGRGLEGDRYFSKEGTYSDVPGNGREITLIEMESIEALERDYATCISPGDARRNIVTRDVALNHLVGKEFRVGDVTLRGMRLSEPCNHLAELTDAKVKAGLVHRGGLRCEIVSDGVIRASDAIEV